MKPRPTGTPAARIAALAFSAACTLVLSANAEFHFDDDGTGLTVLENSRPVFTYHYRDVPPPDGMDPGRWRRSSYIHPLYGIFGETLTEDFPQDHPHHRGVFWAWPQCRAGDSPMDFWTLLGAHQVFERWTQLGSDADRAVLGVQNAWIHDETGRAHVLEIITITTHPANARSRAIDLHLTFTNVSDQPVHIAGQEGKGYGGLTIRPDASRKPFAFTTARGRSDEDALSLDTPWADVSMRMPRSSRYSGVAIFQHPDNPGYPHPGWILRHYGLLGAAWPHTQGIELAPGQTFELRYRLHVHTGAGEDIGLPAVYAEYLSGLKAGGASGLGSGDSLE